MNHHIHTDAPASSVAWTAIIGGAVTAIAISLVLLILGSGLGFATVSPWSRGPSAAAVTATTLIWVIVMQWVSSAFGGYLTGRMRTRMDGWHSDEVFFRDTANGFLAWAVATLFTALFLTSTVTALVGGGAKAATAIAGGAAAGAAAQAGPGPMHGPDENPLSYYVDSLLRTENPKLDDRDVRGETTRILLHGAKEEGISEDDKTYLAKVIASRSNLTQAEAEQRVNDTLARIEEAKAKAKEAADEARKAAAKVSLFTFLSLLVGAFIAAVAAALGGRHRDDFDDEDYSVAA